jgi:hypothetical protein
MLQIVDLWSMAGREFPACCSVRYILFSFIAKQDAIDVLSGR